MCTDIIICGESSGDKEKGDVYPEELKKKKITFLEVSWVLISDLRGFSELDSGWVLVPAYTAPPARTWRIGCMS